MIRPAKGFDPKYHGYWDELETRMSTHSSFALAFKIDPASGPRDCVMVCRGGKKHVRHYPRPVKGGRTMGDCARELLADRLRATQQAMIEVVAGPLFG